MVFAFLSMLYKFFRPAPAEGMQYVWIDPFEVTLTPPSEEWCND